MREPPFGEFDFVLAQRQQLPAAVAAHRRAADLDASTSTPTTRYQFHAPIDHTIFPATVAARHNEISFNLGILGVDVTGLDGPIGRLYIQYGSNVETDRRAGPDGDARLLPVGERLQVHRAGRGRLALPRAARHQPRARHLPLVRRPRELPAAGELELHPRLRLRRDALLLLRRCARSSSSHGGSRSSCGWSTAGRPSASGTRGAPAATSSTGGRASGCRWSTRSTSGRRW